MAENIAPPNGSNAETSTDESSGDDRAPLATLNGKSTPNVGANVKMIKALRDELVHERNNTDTIEENLAELEAKSKKLGQLLDVRGLKVTELKEELKALRKTGSAELAAEKRIAAKSALLELNLQKKIHKKEIKLEVDAVKLEVKAQVALTKEVEKEKAAYKRDVEKAMRSLTSMTTGFEGQKRKCSELSCDLMSMGKEKDRLKEEIKVLKKTVKNLNSHVDNQLASKNKHALQMQRMKNEYRQLGLEDSREKSETKKAGAGGGSSGALNLQQKMDFVSHQNMVKQAGKDSDLARLISKKEAKKKENESNLVFSAGMLATTSNLNGGMWSSNSVGEVSC